MKDDVYLTIKDISEGFYKEKGSKFLAFAIPCEKVEDAKDHIARLRKEHHNACHVCFAWRIGNKRFEDRFSDDGEPSNSAGKPIFGQIQAFDVTNILIAVVRYYGGTNLGVGGLITAYKTAAKEALEKAVIFEDYITSTLRLKYSYDVTGGAMQILQQVDAEIIDQGYEHPDPFILFKIRESFIDELKETIKNTKNMSLESVD
jgi:uncharacterized YigZ family protein